MAKYEGIISLAVGLVCMRIVWLSGVPDAKAWAIVTLLLAPLVLRIGLQFALAGTVAAASPTVRSSFREFKAAAIALHIGTKTVYDALSADELRTLMDLWLAQRAMGMSAEEFLRASLGIRQ